MKRPSDSTETVRQSTLKENYVDDKCRPNSLHEDSYVKTTLNVWQSRNIYNCNKKIKIVFTNKLRAD
jgi:hypothetical protein